MDDLGQCINPSLGPLHPVYKILGRKLSVLTSAYTHSKASFTHHGVYNEIQQESTVQCEWGCHKQLKTSAVNFLQILVHDRFSQSSGSLTEPAYRTRDVSLHQSRQSSVRWTQQRYNSRWLGIETFIIYKECTTPVKTFPMVCVMGWGLDQSSCAAVTCINTPRISTNVKNRLNVISRGVIKKPPWYACSS